MIFLHAGMICPIEVLYVLPWIAVGFTYLKNKLSTKKLTKKV